jgi:hypothetical protein
MKLLRLYPRAWRDRYEAEMIETLEEHDGGFRTKVSLLRGALDAHLHRSIYTTTASHSSRRSATMPTLRLAVIPSCFLVVQFLLSLDLHASSDLENSMGTVAIVAAAIVSTAVGYVAHDARGTRAGLIAGVVNAAASFAIAWFVGFGLTLLTAAGLMRWAYALQGGVLSSPWTGPGVLQELVNPEFLGRLAIVALGASLAGGVFGGAGIALSSLRRWGEHVRV